MVRTLTWIWQLAAGGDPGARRCLSIAVYLLTLDLLRVELARVWLTLAESSATLLLSNIQGGDGICC